MALLKDIKDALADGIKIAMSGETNSITLSVKEGEKDRQVKITFQAIEDVLPQAKILLMSPPEEPA